MKYFICLSVFSIIGCASVPSEYALGCRDGANLTIEQANGLFNSGFTPIPENIKKNCDMLDQEHRKNKNDRENVGKK